MSQIITKSHKDVLNQRSGVFSKYDQTEKELMEMGLIDATPIPFDRYSWDVNAKGLEHIDELEEASGA